jgi:anti-sigma B factor antagonist
MTAPDPFRSQSPAPTGGSQLFTDSYEVRPGVVVVTVAGDIDLATEPALQAALAAVVADPAVQVLVCDLSDVLFLSCGGLSVLIHAQLDLSRRDARLRVVAWRSIAVRIIGLAGLTDMLDLRRDLAEACAPPP